MADLIEAYGSQAGLADATGLSQATISRYARGFVTKMTIKAFAALYRAGAQAERPVNVMISDFLQGE